MVIYGSIGAVADLLKIQVEKEGKSSFWGKGSNNQECPGMEMERPEMGKYHALLPSFKLSKVPTRLGMNSSFVGEQNEYVHMELVGLSREEYERFQPDGVFE